MEIEDYQCDSRCGKLEVVKICDLSLGTRRRESKLGNAKGLGIICKSKLECSPQGSLKPAAGLKTSKPEAEVTSFLLHEDSVGTRNRSICKNFQSVGVGVDVDIGVDVRHGVRIPPRVG